MKVKKVTQVFILLMTFFAFNAFALKCTTTSYDFKTIFPKAWLDSHCKMFPCGSNTYSKMINDFHNIFPMSYLLSFQFNQVEKENVSIANIATLNRNIEQAQKENPLTVNNMTKDRNIGKSRTENSGRNQRLNSHMRNMYDRLLDGNNRVTSITNPRILDEESRSENNFFCYLKLSTRNDLYNQTKGEGRGVVARTILYMIDHYDIKTIPTFIPEDFALLRQWDKRYPPTASECNRNNFIKRKQGNSNKFIDIGCLSQSL